jgi:hypothetical protein
MQDKAYHYFVDLEGDGVGGFNNIEGDGSKGSQCLLGTFKILTRKHHGKSPHHHQSSNFLLFKVKVVGLWKQSHEPMIDYKKSSMMILKHSLTTLEQKVT